jgi:hypothetical protein
MRFRLIFAFTLLLGCGSNGNQMIPVEPMDVAEENTMVDAMMNLDATISMDTTPEASVVDQLAVMDIGRDVPVDTTAPDVVRTDGTTCIPGEPTEVIRTAILVPHCGECHGARRTIEQGLDLFSPGLEARILTRTSTQCAGRRIVVPGNPDGSLLMRKIRGSQGTCGDPMPLGGAPLNLAETARVEAWIRSLTSPCPYDAGVPDVMVGVDAPRPDVGVDAPRPDVGVDAPRPDVVVGVDAPRPDVVVGVDAPRPDVVVGVDAPRPDVVMSAPRLSLDVQPLFVTYCVRCHGTTSPSAGLTLTTGASYRELVGVSASCGGGVLVQSSSPTTSYLINKLTGTGICSGVRMPRGGTALSTTEIDTVRQWIAAGALNN